MERVQTVESKDLDQKELAEVGGDDRDTGCCGAHRLWFGHILCREAGACKVTADTEGLLTRLLKGSVTAAEMNNTIRQTIAAGQYKIKLAGSLLATFPIPPRPRKGEPLDESRYKRYGQEDRQIIASRLTGEIGKTGAMIIYTEGDSAGPTDWTRFVGPPHMHEGVGHISVVTQGTGIFYIAAKTTLLGERMLSIPVTRGDLVFIPMNTIHTFWCGCTGAFDVASFSSKLIRTDSPEFQCLATPQEIERLPLMNYVQYESMRSS